MYSMPDFVPYRLEGEGFNTKITIPLEEEMSLSKKYKQVKLDDDVRLAYEMGALDNNGNLTEEGRMLLLDLLLEDEKIKEQFVSAIKKVKDKEKSGD